MSKKIIISDVKSVYYQDLTDIDNKKISIENLKKKKGEHKKLVKVTKRIVETLEFEKTN